MRKQTTYSSDGYFYLRTPKYPIDTLENTFEIVDTDIGEKHDQFYESVLIASNSLYTAATKNKRTEREIVKLLKYRIRAITRCTPFGGFAGTSVGKFVESTDIVLDGNDFFEYRLDGKLFFDLVFEEALSIKSHWSKLIWYPNSSWYVINDQIRFYEYYQLPNKSREHKLSSVPNDEITMKVLVFCQTGKNIESIRNYLISNDYSEEESESFIVELINNQLLFSELEMTSHGDYQSKAIKVLTQTLGLTVTNSKLVNVFKKIEILKDLDGENRLKVIQEISNLITDNIVDNEKVFNVNMVRQTNKCELNKNLIPNIIEAGQILLDFQSEIPHTDLTLFYDSFLARYEDREVLLVDVIDSEIGIGYPARSHSQADVTPLLRGLKAKQSESAEIENYKVTKNQREIVNVLMQDPDQRVLDLEKIPRVRVDTKTSQSVSVLCSVNKEDIHIKSIVGSSSVNLMSRFSISDSSVVPYLKHSAYLDEKTHGDDTIIPEIDHVPQSRVNNILNRENVRDFTIPILIPGFRGIRCIYLRDITIKISNGNFVLTSKELGKRILPRLSNAHNYHFNSLPIYKFLCDLQFDHVHPSLYWDWGILTNSHHLPRVKFKNAILKRERWRFEIIGKRAKTVQFEEFIESFNRFMTKFDLPKRLNLCDGDNELTLLLENRWCQLIMHEEFQKKGTLILEEDLFDGQDSIVKDRHGYGYNNEFVIPIRKENTQDRKIEVSRSEIFQFNERSKVIGSEWLYFKVYTGLLTADTILVKEIRPIVNQLYKDKIIDGFFFIRYADPHWHLRIRFKLTDTLHLGKVTSLFYERTKKYCTHGAIWKIQSDQYDRELKRYGAENINNTEQIFFADSVFTLETLNKSFSEKSRWHACLLSANQFMDFFNLSLSQKVDFTKMNSLNFQHEFGANNPIARKLINEKYKSNRLEIEDVLVNGTHNHFLIERDKMMSGCYENINKYYENGKLDVEKESLLSSYIHMSVNRIIRSKPRVYEMLIYDFLHSFYVTKTKFDKR